MADMKSKLEYLYGSIKIKVEPSFNEVNFSENGSQEIKTEKMEYMQLHDSIDIKDESLDDECESEQDLGDTESCNKSECGVCKMIFPNDQQLAEHEIMHTSPEQSSGSVVYPSQFFVTASPLYNFIYACKMCDYKTFEMESLPLHLETHSNENQLSGPKELECEICSFKCCREETLKYHLRSHPREKPFKCNFCDFKCAQEENLEVHLRIHTGKQFECTLCDYKAKKKTNLKLHQRTHAVKTCGECNATFTNRLDLEEHEKIHTLPKQFSCAIIDHSRFSVMASRLYKDQVRLVCKMCNFEMNEMRCFRYQLQTYSEVKFPEKSVNSSLETTTKDVETKRKDRHHRIGNKEEAADNEYQLYQDYGRKIRKKIICDVCNATFHNDLELKEHTVLHTTPKQVLPDKRKLSLLTSASYVYIYSCNACGYKTQEQETINDHLRSHLGKNRFFCDYCDYESIRNNIHAHLLTHGKKKPFECKSCGYKSPRRKDMKVHLLTHPETQFNCEFCLYKTNKRASLTSHLRKHSGKSLIFKCNVCDFESSVKQTLKAHVISHLNEQAYKYKICCNKCFT